MQKVALVQEISSKSAPGCIGVGAGINDHERPVGAAFAIGAPTMGSALANVRHKVPIAPVAVILNARDTSPPHDPLSKDLTLRQVQADRSPKRY
jgi:hypothetical protein